MLEYRVWCHPEDGAEDLHDGSDYFEVFADFPSALSFSERTRGAERPLALVLQREYIDEPTPGTYRHVRRQRVTEWPVELLLRPRRTPSTIPDLFASGADEQSLAVLRGEIR